MALIAKYIPSLSEQQKEVLKKLSSLNFETFNETDVREEFLVPLVDLLGYERNSDYQVLREIPYALDPLFLRVGAKRIKLDYSFNVYKTGFWLLEAKSGRCIDPTQPPSISNDMVEQAFFYAHHREIDCSIFGVSNGWWINLYDRDAEDSMQAILSISHRDLPDEFLRLYEKIGATQVVFELKRRILRRMEQVLAADVDLERMDEFIQQVRSVAARVRPRVVENFRKNARTREANVSQALIDYLENSRPFDIIQTVMMANLDRGQAGIVTQIMARKLSATPGVDQFLFFHRLVVADTRVVTISYYLNALLTLLRLYRNPDMAHIDYPICDGARQGDIRQIFWDFVRMILFHFASRPDLRVIWAMEGLVTRMASRALVSNETSRREIAAGVDFERYLLPEQEIAYLGPSPGGAIAEAVQRITLAELGAFVMRHSTGPDGQEFDTHAAREEFRSRRIQFEPIEAATATSFRELVQRLGIKWGGSFGAPVLHRTWDKLGFAACDYLSGFPDVLSDAPKDIKSRLRQLSMLGNTFARQCCIQFGEPVSEGEHPHTEERLLDLFDPDKSPIFEI
jgi:hypothetical protein